MATSSANDISTGEHAPDIGGSRPNGRTGSQPFLYDIARLTTKGT